MAPVVEPSGPVFGYEEGLVGLKGCKEIHFFLVLAGAEVDSGETPGMPPRGSSSPPSTVSRSEAVKPERTKMSRICVM